jgi:V8-like Glu-specific endopeptidase
MPKLTSAQQADLLDLLLAFPGTKEAGQREALLFSLPPQIVNSLDLSGNRYAAIARLIESLEFWGQLADGRWATEVMLRNALRAARDTQYEQKIEAIRQIFDLPAAKVTLKPLPEQIASEVSYLMPAGFLEAGARAARAVARLCVPRVIDGTPIMFGTMPSLVVGTGWLVAPGLLLTNHHVIEARFDGENPATEADIAKQAIGMQAWFDYIDVMKPFATYCVTKLESLSQPLDYALLRVSEAPMIDAHPPLSSWGFLRLAPEKEDWRQGMPLNIIQHPAGDVKQIAIRRNDFIGLAEGDEFYYLTDTLPGSSGSPVFNDDWHVVGLHRASQTRPEKVYMKGETIKYNNVGVRIHAIRQHWPASIQSEVRTAGR